MSKELKINKKDRKRCKSSKKTTTNHFKAKMRQKRKKKNRKRIRKNMMKKNIKIKLNRTTKTKI